MLKILLIFLTTLPLQINAESCQESLLKLVRRGELINQMDSRLFERRLIVENGGLCGLACIVNSVHAIGDYLQKDTSFFQFNSDQAIHDLFLAIKRQYGHDSRMGAALRWHHAIGPALGRKWLGVDLNVDVIGGPSELMPLIPNDFQLASDRLGIISVRISGNTSHAVQLLDINQKRKTISYVNPHNPTRVDTDTYFEIINSRGDLRTLHIPDFLPGFSAAPRKGEVQGLITIHAKLGKDISAPSIRSKTLKKGQIIRFKSNDGKTEFAKVLEIDKNGSGYLYLKDMTGWSWQAHISVITEIILENDSAHSYRQTSY